MSEKAGSRLDAELARELRRPVAAGDIRFKIQESGDAHASVVSYVEARLVTARLNHLVPGEWEARHEALPLSMRLTMQTPDGEVPARARYGKTARDTRLFYVCRLRIRDSWFEDAGEGEEPLATYSQSLKRAAVRAGVGEFLYSMALPTLYAPAKGAPDPRTQYQARRLEIAPQDLSLTGHRQHGDRQRPYLTQANVQALRRVYELWLERVGIAAFGEPLGHGPSPPAEIRASDEEAPGTDDEKDEGQEAPAGSPPDRATLVARMNEAAARAKVVTRTDIARIGVVLAARDDGGVEISEESSSEIVQVIGDIARQGWSAERVAREITAALEAPASPNERRQRFLARLAEPGRLAA